MPSFEDEGRGADRGTTSIPFYNFSSQRSTEKLRPLPLSTPQGTTNILPNSYNGTESTNGSAKGVNSVAPNADVLQSIPNGRSSGSTYSRERRSRDGSTPSTPSGAPVENGGRSSAPSSASRKAMEMDGPIFVPIENGNPVESSGQASPKAATMANGDGTMQSSSPIESTYPQTNTSSIAASRSSGYSKPLETGNLQTKLHSHSNSTNRYSSPPALSPSGADTSGSSLSSATHHPGLTQLRHRHTLQVPKLQPSRTSREYSSNISDDIATSSGRFSPTVSGGRRASMTLGRRPTRSIHSDMHADEVAQDEDAARWTEAIRIKRASRRRRKEEDDDDRVIVGIKVDQHHVNWVTAYNMLTGIRFCVSRTNAKIDRELTDADFDAKHKFSFDITGNELTPSAKYDFKFKDYAPWVFRHLRMHFRLDPGDYLMSLTSKYILSELGSPGKSGSFFYFSRDYKYIIKTIHHGEHKLLRKILRDYYQHVQDNPNTLISQFYGLHRVKIPYGRKIHFVIMNNLFPPHRDIHQTFDLKGSTIGRDFKEEDLAANPRATLKDLNWLRRNLHLEFGPTKKEMFIAQMERDVKLLQRLKIMDYSLLVGIHDMGKGNEENLRGKTLRVFQPGGERQVEEPAMNMLTRTPSKLETARKARELRQIIKMEKPVPMGEAGRKMPEMTEERRDFAFYSDEGGFQATHEDDRAGEEIYYLGIIDCLTHYGFVKKAETLWKGMFHSKSQLSPIPPEAYGTRFIRFITGITMSREAAAAQPPAPSLSLDHASLLTPTTTSMPASSFVASTPALGSGLDMPSPEKRSMTLGPAHLAHANPDNVMEKAERQARKSERNGRSEEDTPERTIKTVRSPSAERAGGLQGTTLPIVEEGGSERSVGADETNEKAEQRGEARVEQ